MFFITPFSSSSSSSSYYWDAIVLMPFGFKGSHSPIIYEHKHTYICVIHHIPFHIKHKYVKNINEVVVVASAIILKK